MLLFSNQKKNFGTLTVSAFLLAAPLGAFAHGAPANVARKGLQPVGAPVRAHIARTISGTITDEKGEGLPGVNILVKGTQKGTISDVAGKFSIDLSEQDAVLIISFVGYLTEEVPVGNQTQLSIRMKTDQKALEEVVVVGYGTMKRSSLTGSISTIESKQIATFPAVNVLNAMQGQASGVLVGPSRQPGEAPSIRIRGSRSLSASNSPLLIIDGMPGNWDNLVSTDVESMEVLKDAAATAIYGSRAANGVVLVTTKSAAKGANRMSIEVGGYAGVNRYNFIPMQSAEKYAELIRDVMRYQTHGAVNTEAWQNSTIDTRRGLEMFNSTWASNYYDKGINYDWQKALFNRGSVTQGYNVSIGNRTDKLNYRLSYNFQNDNSYYKTVNYKRHVLNANAELHLTKWLNIGTITRLSTRMNTGWPDNMWDNMRRMTPFETPYIDEDPANGLKDAVGKEKYVNALWNYQDGNLLDDRKGQMADILLKADIKPFSWMKLTTNFKYDVYNQTNGLYRDSRTSYQNLGLNYASYENASNSNYTWNGILNIDKNFKNVHQVNLTGVVEAIKSDSTMVGASSQNIPAKYMGYHFLQTGIVNRDIRSAYSKSTLLSYMFRGQYEYMGRYLLNFAVRADGSSRLAPQNRWRTFPSFSAAWVISEENFLKDQSLVTTLKVRASYGEVGNQAIRPYQTLTTLSQSTYNWGSQGVFSWQPAGIANKSLGWEVSKTWNAGIDFGLANNRVSGSLELYQTRNEGLLTQRVLPEGTGFSNIWQNIGETLNKGIELTLTGNLINKKDLDWSVTGMASYNKSEITRLTEGQDDRANKWFIGHPVKVVWDHKKTGIWQVAEQEEAKKYNMQPGEIKIVDRDGDFAFTDEDRFILGQVEPKVLASIQSSLRYRQFDLGVNLVGQFGHYITASNYTAEWNADKYIIDAVNWWTPLNPTNDWPRAHTAQSHRFSSTLSIFRGDFIKIQNISVGFNPTVSLFGHQMNRARIYLQASNAFYLFQKAPSAVNPEQPNTMYTIPASYVLGLNLNL
ncbi:TonB-dependent receptor [Ravibacter arvi]|uniref:TonB-dependent receptor n=1 Tax=Ravibacter arvi TaxID=2051041 RepID=A0ABP8LW33_9BACT